MALDPHCEQSDPRVGPGKFNNNPINEDMREAGALLHPVFGINIVVNSASRHSGLFCGDFDAAWRESCKYVQQCYGLPIKDQADVVFVSCGGFPKDLNFYQGSKSLFMPFVPSNPAEHLSCWLNAAKAPVPKISLTG